jgi:hypothetical protein
MKGYRQPQPHDAMKDTMLEKLISDALIRDTETKRVTDKLSVTRVHETRHRLAVAHAPGTRRVTNNNVSVTLEQNTRH